MNRGKKRLLYGLCVLCAAGAAASGWGLYQELKPRAEAERLYGQIREQAFPRTGHGGRAEAGMTAGAAPDEAAMRGEPDWEALWKENPDICGWIYCPGTAIDYPVVQGQDNEWYLNHTADQKKSAIGSIFLEARNQRNFGDDVSVLYGHHIRGGRMFTPVSGYKNQKYYEEHPRMYLYTPEENYQAEIFAGEILNGSTGGFPQQFRDAKERKRWLTLLYGRGAFQGAQFPGSEDRILALCTCTYEYQDARYAVYGILKKLEIDEDEERRTEDETNSENDGTAAVLPDDDASSGHDSAG